MITGIDTDSPDYRERMQIVVQELRSESDRNVAIVGGAWVEEGISGVLQAAFQPDSAIWKRVTGSYGPLSSFSAMIDVARLLNLVSSQIYSDLNTIRSIRNTFAHDIAHKKTRERLSFASNDIKDKCLSLHCIARGKPTDPRQAFIRACAMLSADFESMQMFVQIPHLGTVNAPGEDC